MELIIEKVPALADIISKLTPNSYAIILSTLSFFISLYNAISPHITKIKVSVLFDNKKLYNETGYSLTSSCHVAIRNLSQKTKYIQSVYMKYRYTSKSRKYGTFLVTDELLAIEPQEMIRIPIKIDKNTFLKEQNNSTRVYAIAVDSLGKKWASSDSLPVAVLLRLTLRG